MPPAAGKRDVGLVHEHIRGKSRFGTEPPCIRENGGKDVQYPYTVFT